MQNKKNVFLIFINTLINPLFYKHLLDESFGRAFGYLYLVLVLFGIAQSIVYGVRLAPQYPTLVKTVGSFRVIAKNFYPDELKIVMKNGMLSTNVKEPYYLYLPKEFSEGGKKITLGVINTSAVLDDYDSYNVPVLITKKGIIMPGKETGERRVYLFSSMLKESKIKEFTLTKDIYMVFVKQAEPFVNKLPSIIQTVVIVFLIVWPFLGSFFYLWWKLFVLLFGSLLIFGIAKILKKSISYKGVYKVGMFALTLPIVISQIQQYAGAALPYLLQSDWIGAAAFLLMMVLAVSQL